LVVVLVFVLLYIFASLYIDVQARSRPHCCAVLYCIVLFSYSRSPMQSDDGYICTAETCSCCYMCDRSCVQTAVLHTHTHTHIHTHTHTVTVPKDLSPSNCTVYVAYCVSVFHLAVRTAYMVAC
jgi:hypothetical protein